MNPGFRDLVITRWSARFMGRVMPCAIGRGGIGEKQGEGDGITPVGRFRIGGVRLRPDRISLNCGAPDLRAIGLNSIWSDDPKDPAYNTELTSASHPFGHEALRRADPLYDLLAILDYNWPVATPGKGSALFLHIWRKPRHPTEGCVAFAQQHLLWILANWTGGSLVVIKG